MSVVYLGREGREFEKPHVSVRVHPPLRGPGELSNKRQRRAKFGEHLLQVRPQIFYCLLTKLSQPSLHKSLEPFDEVKLWVELEEEDDLVDSTDDVLLQQPALNKLVFELFELT